jgi:DNA replication protein DnaC
MGPVGVGKTFLATALGHAAVRARHSVHFERAGQLLKRLKATRLDNSHDEQIRKLLHTDLLILDLSRARDYPDRWPGWSRPRW